MDKNLKTKLTVLMPVYNAAPYLDDSIQSILDQDFMNFEFLIIDDGSTDLSLKIIKKYAKKDKRIVYKSRDNQGIGHTLNEGLSLARGKFIARMDADDISLPGRLGKQIHYLEAHPECTALFTKVQLIDPSGRKKENWGPDVHTTSPEEIKALMPKENCCAHPSVMMKASDFKQYSYDATQVPTEDYDLWLRILSAGGEVHKLNEKLLLYRVVGSSISQSSNRKVSPQRKILRSKRKFLTKQIRHGNFGAIEIKVFYSILGLLLSFVIKRLRSDLSKITPRSVKRFAHAGLLFLSNIIPTLRHVKAQVHISLNRRHIHKIIKTVPDYGGKTGVLVIVPWMTVGGAEKILLDIIRGITASGFDVFCISTTKKSNEWAGLYKEVCSEVVDIGDLALEENKDLFITEYLIKKNIKTVLTTNNIYGYRAAKKIKSKKSSVKVFDILHGEGGEKEGGGWPLFSAPYDGFIDKRIVVTDYLKKYLVKKHGINPDKIIVVHNGIEAFKGLSPPPADEIEAAKGRFVVLWAGRFSYEKHPELAIETAKIVAKINKNVHTIIAGDGELRGPLIQKVKDYKLQKFVTITERPYSNPRSYMDYSDVLLMSSEMEGLPVVILESFATGLPVIAPNVGGIPELVKDDKSGYLINFSSIFADKAADKIIKLSQNRKLGQNLGNTGYKLVSTEFLMTNMISSYIEILGTGKSSLE